MQKHDYFAIPLLAILTISCFVWSIRTSNTKNQNETQLEQIHFLVPGGAGGGWDTTARTVGDVLRTTKTVPVVSFENMSGGGGGKAIAHLIEKQKHQQQTLMVNSTPIVIRSLQKVFPQSFRDLTPVASVIGDYSCLVVDSESPIQTWPDFMKDYQKQPRKVTIAGGSVRGGMDHLVAAMICKACNISLDDLVYVPYDAGGKALAGLLSGEAQILATGLGEAMELTQAGKLRILAVTAENPIPSLANIPTFTEMGYSITFVNWRGFFGPPGISPQKLKLYDEAFQKMFATKEWQTARERNGWSETYTSGKQFSEFLSKQESHLKELMKEMGFIR